MRVNLLILIFLVTVLVSCGFFDAPNPVDEGIAGTYQFKYPSGQIEVIEIRNDYTYSQTVHLRASYAKNDSAPLIKNSGTWSFETARRLGFGHWLSYCEMSDPSRIRDEPELSSESGIVWDPPNRIWFYDQTGYVFERVDK
ncbi:MAG: hypothetical protein IT236_02705 [Bacteroidia bacterium]|nr:hypothetical protein [Bacteroidia bacterium]